MSEKPAKIRRIWFASSGICRWIYSSWNHVESAWRAALQESLFLKVARRLSAGGSSVSAGKLGIVLLSSTAGNSLWEWPGWKELTAVWLIPRITFCVLGALFLLAGSVQLGTLIKGSKFLTGRRIW